MSPKKMNSPTNEVKETKTASIKVLALWNSFTPDCRPYKPSTPFISFVEPLTVAIDVPLETELIKNAGVIASAQLTNQSEPKPQFTPLGMRYIIDQFEAVMQIGKHEEVIPNDDVEWEETEVTAETKPAKSDDEEWEDEDTTKTEKSDDAPWAEDWEE